jgi:hypothetical protein
LQVRVRKETARSELGGVRDMLRDGLNRGGH